MVYNLYEIPNPGQYEGYIGDRQAKFGQPKITFSR